MPWIGLPPFLPDTAHSQLTLNRLCQCPGSGYLHFYDAKEDYKKEHEECVNALDRATSISTQQANTPT